MRQGARAAAAIEVLAEIEGRHRPASEALKDWGRAHRFAGAGDRAAIGNLVYDVLRRRASFAFRMGDDRPRALVLAALAGRGLDCEALSRLFVEPHAPEPLGEDERARLAAPPPEGAPDWVRGDYPEWLTASFERAFGGEAAAEGAALARRAPVDLRANALKADRDRVLAALKRFGPVPGPWSPWCVRLGAPEGDGRTPDVEAEPAHAKGWFEVQDAGSQAAAIMAGARPGMQVLDLCAGAGGKTLALAAAMGNRGQVFATDRDRHRLRPIFDRLKRAGVRNAQVLPAGEADRLADLEGRMDLVLVDAPCSGSGAWRRRPDAKWRLTPRVLEDRLAEQTAVLRQAVAMAKPGGRIVYVTCSVLPEENGDRIEALLAAEPRLGPDPLHWEAGSEAPFEGAPSSALLTPARHSTDGFFVAALRKTA